MALFLHSDIPMMKYFADRDDVNSATSIEKWISTSVVSFNLRYGKRAFYTINTMMVSALVYIKNDIDENQDDPMIERLERFAQFLRDRNFGFLTIVGEPKDKIF